MPTATSSRSTPPPRLSSSPPPRSSPRLRAASNLPGPHEDFDGASGAAVHFRPARLNASAMALDLVCSFRCDGAVVGPLALVDLSAAGFAATVAPGVCISPGSALEGFELHASGKLVWSGEAVLVHGSDGRIGGRFTSGVVDLQQLRLGATLESRLALLRDQRARLPGEWRAAVSDLRQLLEDARFELEEIERGEHDDALRGAEEEAKLLSGLRDRWGAEFYEAVSALHAMSKGLDPATASLGRTYASSTLMPLLSACPLNRRAYEKPLGYAGDFRMMELVFTEELGGEGLFGRFLHLICQNYTLARAVVGRASVTREAVRSASETPGEGPVRILALAAGPAIELRKFLQQVVALNRPVELILLDQDRTAHETAHAQLVRILLEQHKGILPVTVRCLHFSVRQLLRPRTAEEQRIVRETLRDLDLVYSAGLYDYLPERIAVALTRVLYGRLREGGRLLLGNLVETPDSTWIMDYVWGWPLIYRTEESMLRLGDGLAQKGARVGITSDVTGRCLFLDVVRPAEDSSLSTL
jgi:extracellular factor (EF) 3-hydroxypalmitic acid methyl ester biosynthesis protein